MTRQPLFSERHGYTESQDKKIVYQTHLPTHLRRPIIDLIKRYGLDDDFLSVRIKAVFDPYGLTPLPPPKATVETIGRVLTALSQNDNYNSISVQPFLSECEWPQFYDLLEDITQQLIIEDGNIARWPDERRTPDWQNDLNEYFRYAGIGWNLINGEIVARGDDAFEHTTQTAELELKAGKRETAALRIRNSIRCLSVRPTPDLSGAVSHATGALESVLHDITGEKKTLGEYIKSFPNLFPGSLQKAIQGIWGYASEEGARHGLEGIEPGKEEADFIVSVCASLVTFLNRKHPRVEGNDNG